MKNKKYKPDDADMLDKPADEYVESGIIVAKNVNIDTRKQSNNYDYYTTRVMSEGLRDDVRSMLIANKGRLQRELDSLEGRDYVECYIKLFKEVVPSFGNIVIGTSGVDDVDAYDVFEKIVQTIEIN